MNSARHAIAATLTAGAAVLALKALRVADDARLVIGPSARAAVEAIHDPHIPTEEAVAVAQAATTAEEGNASD